MTLVSLSISRAPKDQYMSDASDRSSESRCVNTVYNVETGLS